MIGDKVCTKESYLLYREITKEEKVCPVPRDMYGKIVNEFLQFLVDKMFDGHDICLPGLGMIGIRTRKVVPRLDIHGNICGVAPSWAKTKILWTEKAAELGMTFNEYVAKVPKEQRELVYCFNEHSNGLKYGLMWYRKGIIIRNKTFYSLIFCRKAKRRLMRAAWDGVEYQEAQPKYSSRSTQTIIDPDSRAGRYHAPCNTVEVIDD